MSRANWPIGYHWSSGWAGRLDAEYDAHAKDLKRVKMNLAGFECFDWFEKQPCDCKKTGGSARYGGCNTKAHWKDAQRFVAAMWRKGVTTVVTFENRNSCACRAKDDEWRRKQYRKALKLAEFGPIWIIPVSEPWVTSLSVKDFVTWAHANTPPHVPLVLPNRGKSRIDPYYGGALPAFAYDIHPGSIAEAEAALRLGNPALVQTDHSGTLDPGPTNAYRLAKLSAQTKTPLLIYRFEGDPRRDTIAAMGKAIAEAL